MDNSQIGQKTEQASLIVVHTPQTMLDWLKFLLKKWKLIIVIGFLGAAIGFIYAFNQEPQFESSLTFALDGGGNSDGASGIAGIAAQFGFNLGGAGGDNIFGGENIMEIITSRRMIEAVLLSNDTVGNKITTMADEYSIVLKKKWKNKSGPIHVTYPVGLAKEKFSYIQDSILYCMYSEISANNLNAFRPDKKYNIFEINFQSPDERFTKVFTDKILFETTQFYTELRTKKSQQTIDALESRIENLKDNLYGSLAIKADVQDANINPSFATGQVPLQKQQMNIKAYGEAYGEIYKNLELARYQFLLEVPLLQVINPANYPMKRVKASKLKLAIAFSLISVLLLIGIIITVKKLKVPVDN